LTRRKKLKLPLLNFTDLPVADSNKNKVLAYVSEIVEELKWFNGIIVRANSSILDSLKQKNFVKSVMQIGLVDENAIKKTKIDLNDRVRLLEQKFVKENLIDSSSFYGKSKEQIELCKINALHQTNFDGKEVNIAVFDAGFNNLDQLEYFKHLKIKQQYNLVNRDESIFSSDNDEHGTHIMSCLAGFIPYKYIGAAPAANYYLFKTENANSEYPIEEYLWAKAAEIADSLGVDIITSSIGYTEFDKKDFGHKPKELNGKTTIIAQAANMAASKGILVVNSAGNEGDKIWEKLATPADADSVLTIAACNLEKKIASFSSIGFEKGNKIKPDVAALGEKTSLINKSGEIFKSNGTSYATPLVSGGAACLMQANRNASPFQIKEALKLSASNYFKPNIFGGYGVPDFQLANVFLQTHTQDTLLQLNQLSDQNFHASIYSAENQKIEITFQLIEGKEVYKHKFKLKAGINRFVVTKSSKIKQGFYLMKVKTNQTVILSKQTKFD
jgi:subtilisin family serine protease